jgi:hypothetical protein
MLYKEFVASAAARRRYWARSMVGWQVIAGARPNAAHLALARLEATGRLHHLVTQNVDSLHQRAGSRRVLDLHGRLDRVECLECRTLFRRRAFQEELLRLNPGWGAGVDTSRLTQDGDAEATLKVEGRCGESLAELARRLALRGSSSTLSTPRARSRVAEALSHCAGRRVE